MDCSILYGRVYVAFSWQHWEAGVPSYVIEEETKVLGVQVFV